MTVKITTQTFRKAPSVSRPFFAKKRYSLGILTFFLAFLLFNSCASKIPTSTFSGTQRPAAPNYSDLKNWAAHPDKHDNADSIPMNSSLKDGQSTAEVDVFFVHPTTFTLKKGVNVWNADLGDAPLNQKTDNGSILFQASIFNEVGRIYAPRYRQAYYGIYLSRDTASNRQALALAYEDVKASFEYYLKNWNNGRPIIIAAHSQGAQHAGRLLKEFFEGKTLRNRLVVAYIVGMPMPKNLCKDIKVCDKPEETGCFCSWRTFKTGYEPVKFRHDDIAVVNPLSMSSDLGLVATDKHLGGVLIGFKKQYEKNITAEIHNDILWISKPKFRGSFFYRTPNYHIGDFNLFYFNIREDAKRRVGLFWKQ